jgi:hypothetical protein
MTDINNPNIKRLDTNTAHDSQLQERFRVRLIGSESGPHLNMPHFTVQHAKDAVDRLKIRTKKQYKERHREDPRLPEHPNTFYKKEWALFGGWKSFLYSPERYPTFHELRSILKEKAVYTQKQYNRSFLDDERLPESPQFIYAKEWTKQGGWTGLLPSRFMSYAELKTFIEQKGITTKRQYQELCRTHPRAPSYPANVYSEMWEKNGKWRGLLDKPSMLAEPEEIWQLLQNFRVRSLKDMVGRDSIDRRLRPESIRLLRKHFKRTRDLRFIFYNTYTPLIELPERCRLMGINTVRDYYKVSQTVGGLPKYPNSVYAKHGWGLLGGWNYILSKPITVKCIQEGVDSFGLHTPTDYNEFKNSNFSIATVFESVLNQINASEIKERLAIG